MVPQDHQVALVLKASKDHVVKLVLMVSLVLEETMEH